MVQVTNEQAMELFVEKQQASASLLQRKFCIGYMQAKNIIAELESMGCIGPFSMSSPRKVLVTLAEARRRAKGGKS